MYMRMLVNHIKFIFWLSRETVKTIRYALVGLSATKLIYFILYVFILTGMYLPNIKLRKSNET